MSLQDLINKYQGTWWDNHDPEEAMDPPPINDEDMLKKGIIAWCLSKTFNFEIRIPVKELVGLINGSCDIRVKGDVEKQEYIVRLVKMRKGDVTRWDHEDFNAQYKKDDNWSELTCRLDNILEDEE